ncbi:MAG: diheme cytochrome c [Rubrivivax sp.]|nr:diheme cytochrome c [Rubrivivax sp.]
MTPSLNRALLTAGLVLAPLAAAWADGGRTMPLVVPPAYAQECGACHAAYAPGLLPARSWQRILGGLDRHYGTDASLDPATVRQLGVWLEAHAGTYKRVRGEPPEDRITRSAWFERKHRKVEPAVWQLPSVKSAANCAACHAGADHGRFDDDDLRQPAGLTPRQRRAWLD